MFRYCRERFSRRQKWMMQKGDGNFFKCRGFKKEEKIKILSTNGGAGLDRQQHLVYSNRKKAKSDLVNV